MHSTEILNVSISCLTLLTQKDIHVTPHCKEIKSTKYIKFTVFWDVTPYDLVGGYHHFERTQ
jgi:hypothetical protein